MAGISVPLRPTLATLLSFLTLGVLALALLLGGGTQQGLWSDALVQLASLPLLAIALYRGDRWPPGALRVWSLVVAAAALSLPLLQLLPLPASLWTRLPGRDSFASAYALAGSSLPPLPISLAPGATMRSFLAMLPAAAVFVAVLSLDARSRRAITLFVLAFAFLSVFLDLAQLVGGPQSSLRFYRFTNEGQAVGFFANRNHNAALLYCAVPLATAWAVGLIAAARPGRNIGLALLGLVYVAILLGLSMARSRAGLALTLLAGLASIPLAMTGAGEARVRRRILMLVAGANLVGLVFAFQFGFVGIVERIETDSVLEDLRWPAARTTLEAARGNLPFGTGMGSFQRIYAMHETPGMLRDVYVNHAHDDWLELALEAGLPGLAVQLGFLVWFGSAAVTVWRRPQRHIAPLDSAVARAGSLIAGLLLLHSALDYPLRTTALSTLFGLACALLVPPAVAETGPAANRALRPARIEAQRNWATARRLAATLIGRTGYRAVRNR